MPRPQDLPAPPRQPRSFRERVLAQFRTPGNQRHIAQALGRVLPPGPRLEAARARLPGALAEYGTTFGPGGALVDADPLAMRGRAGGGGNLVEELQHLNRAFFRHLVGEAPGAPPPPGPGLGRLDEYTSGPGPATEGEPLYYRLFEGDSLRPPGLEGLNGPGPLWGDQLVPQIPPEPGMAQEDQAWRAGDAGSSAAHAAAEYFGLDGPISSAMGLPTAGAAPGPRAPARCGWDGFFARPEGLGGLAREAAAERRGEAGVQELLAGTAARYERREAFPYWQRAGHRPALYTGRWQSGAPGGGDFEETLGRGAAEFGGGLGCQVRGWNMDRLREPRGESYLRLGPRQNAA